MHITVEKKEGKFEFLGLNEDGKSVKIDASPEIGGGNTGVRPMQLLIMGLGGCSGIDILNILYKQKQDIKIFRMEIDAEREKDAVPSLFSEIKITFIFNEGVDKVKAEKAIDLSLDKYCSVAKTLEKTAKITYDLKFEK